MISLNHNPRPARATVAEFHKDSGNRLILFSLTVIRQETDRRDGCGYLMREVYDVEHSRRYGYLFHMSGCGGGDPVPVSGIYFASGDVEVKEAPSTLVNRKSRKRNRTRRLRVIPKSFTLKPAVDLLDWLENNAIQEDAVYCSTCRDYLPGTQLCEHCWWCENIGWYSTPNDRCECGRESECRA